MHRLLTRARWQAGGQRCAHREPGRCAERGAGRATEPVRSTRASAVVDDGDHTPKDSAHS